MGYIMIRYTDLYDDIDEVERVRLKVCASENLLANIKDPITLAQQTWLEITISPTQQYYRVDQNYEEQEVAVCIMSHPDNHDVRLDASTMKCYVMTILQPDEADLWFGKPSPDDEVITWR